MITTTYRTNFRDAATSGVGGADHAFFTTAFANLADQNAEIDK